MYIYVEINYFITKISLNSLKDFYRMIRSPYKILKILYKNFCSKKNQSVVINKIKLKMNN